MGNKKLAELNMRQGRVIKGLITEPISKDYYEVQVVKIENPIKGDWRENDVVKISKELVYNFKFL